MEKQATPVVGEGATLHLWSDSQAYTVIRVSPSGKTAWLQRDKAVLLNGSKSGEPDALKVYPGGFAAHVQGKQRYRYEPNPEGQVIRASKRTLPNGKVVWKTVGHPTRSPGNTVTFNGRHEHYDYNF